MQGIIALGTLPARDTHLACLERDIAAILDGAADQDMRRLLRRYATWGLLRHARAQARQAPQTSGIRHGQAARLKTAVRFTSWLASRGLDLAACRQSDLDTYLLACPARRDEVRHFLALARRYRDRALTVAQAPRPDTTVPLAQDQRCALTRSLLHDNGHDPGDRVAGLLVLLFGQRPGRIARLTTSHISPDAGHTMLTLGTTPIRIPNPSRATCTTSPATAATSARSPPADPARGCSPACIPDSRSWPPPSATGWPASGSTPSPAGPAHS